MARQILFIDGVGGKRYMRGALVRYFERHGYTVHCFDYLASRQSLDAIKQNLMHALSQAAQRGEYSVIGYSFGGVLLRMLWNEISSAAIQPSKVVLLASPIGAMRLGARLRDWRIYRLLCGECGQFAADRAQMATLTMPTVPTACVYGTWPWLGALGILFGFGFAHDGMVAAQEAAPPAPWPAIAVSASHAFIPSNPMALDAIGNWLTATH
ncbi:hypothetical protein SAMN05192549_101137 [Duganella sacchari]|uniref:Alpha/beta hydrolase family protein n=1 Tax=Duganella sacchari TaxID=551987 RepID=A0A1M7HD54_9BURK|nr:hypothetical protein [Duganella sacchari]SHM26329.1 hypothetical protein SAMN05192549_101137 [Duganella sacchari]